MSQQGGGVPLDLGPLLCAPVAQRLAEAWIGNPVATTHQRRQEAARDLVLALCARLEAGQAFAQAIFDAW